MFFVELDDVPDDLNKEADDERLQARGAITAHYGLNLAFKKICF
jgi:hypothetical protein